MTYALVAGVTALVVYTLLLGVGLLTGQVPVDRAYALMSVPPFVTAIWQMIGFVRSPGYGGTTGDTGLLIGALGWLASGTTLLVMHSAVTSALSQGQRLDQVSTPAIAWFLAVLGAAGIVGGSVMSWQMWQRMAKDTGPF